MYTCAIERGKTSTHLLRGAGAVRGASSGQVPSCPYLEFQKMNASFDGADYGRSNERVIASGKGPIDNQRSSPSVVHVVKKALPTRMRSSSPPPQRHTRSSDGSSETSPLALGSAPVYRPHPPRSAERAEDSAGKKLSGLRLPPVASASQQSSSPDDRSPLRNAPLFNRFDRIPLYYAKRPAQ